jgi:two-component system, chemotaxis family, protein-glutamate methylesterase/glutaminase
VIHTSPDRPLALARILDRCGTVPVTVADHSALLQPGHAYVAVPGRHLILRDGSAILTSTAKQNRARPAIDALFRSAARWYGPRTIGIVLSGVLDDGAAGLAAVDARGGVCIVQDPAEAPYPGMPQAALSVVPDALIRSTADLAATVDGLCRNAGTPETVSETPDHIGADMIADANEIAIPVGLGCPDCGGGLSSIQIGAAEYYRCHVGHGYAPANLLAAQHEKAEAGLWTAISMLQEQAAVHERLAERAQAHGGILTARHQRAAADELRRAADTIGKHFPETALIDSGGPDISDLEQSPVL